MNCTIMVMKRRKRNGWRLRLREDIRRKSIAVVVAVAVTIVVVVAVIIVIIVITVITITNGLYYTPICSPTIIFILMRVVFLCLFIGFLFTGCATFGITIEPKSERVGRKFGCSYISASTNIWKSMS